MTDSIEIDDWSVTRPKVDEAVRRIVKHANPLQIIAFGSRARGDHREDSDLDLAVIVDESRMDTRKDLPSILFSIRLDHDLLVVTKDRYDLLRPWLNSVYNDIDREGLTLYDREHPERSSRDALHVSSERPIRSALRVA